MLVLDQLKKDDPQLRFLAVVVAVGMLILLGGLWWVQVVSSDYYQQRLETQSLRTVRIPAVRGSILDRDGRIIAENQPAYNVDLYLEDLSKNFEHAYDLAMRDERRDLSTRATELEHKLGRKLNKQEKRQFYVTSALMTDVRRRTRFDVSRQIVASLGSRLQLNIPFDEKNFQKRFGDATALPYPVLHQLNPTNLARFEEQSMHTPGLDLDVQSLRYYPNGDVAAHLLGYVTRNAVSTDHELADYNYRLEDYSGQTGLERMFDAQLRGTAGAKSVLVNNQGFRQSESVWAQAEPGMNVYLTIDLEIQKVAEAALQSAEPHVRGAVVVMDAQNGDVLALASAPTYNPNLFVQRLSPEAYQTEWEHFSDTNARPQMNRATFENYPPGSIFKTIVGLAALEQGVLDPNALYDSPGSYPLPGRSNMKDLAPPGLYNFDRALAQSCNCYFVEYGIKPGVLQKVIALGHQLHLGEKTGLLPNQETTGAFPTLEDTKHDWHLGTTAYLSIGQGPIAVTPLQMAVMTAAIANGGKVLHPRLVTHTQGVGADQPSQVFPPGGVWNALEVSQHNLELVRKAMVADVEFPKGTGHKAFVEGFRIGGKTGTAQVEKNGHIAKDLQITWFASFAPYDNPRYAVIAMVESGSSGGGTCAPIAHRIYQLIHDRELQRARTPRVALAQMP